MRHYLLTYELVPDYLERRLPLRERHLTLAWEAAARGEMVLGGALTDPVDTAVILFAAVDDDAARRWVEWWTGIDPYVTEGLVRRWFYRRWVTVVGDAAAEPVRP